MVWAASGDRNMDRDIYDLFLGIEKRTGFDIGLLIKNMLFLENVDMSHMWYMPMILGLYLFLPFIANGLKKINDSSVLVFPLLIVFLVFFVVPVLNVFSLCATGTKIESLFFEGFSGGVYGFYLFLGYCVKRGSFKKISSPVLMMLCILFFGCVISLQFFAYSQKVGAPVWYSSGLLFVAAFSLFLLFSRNKYLKQRTTVTLLSDYSFALYLVHFPVIVVISSIVKSFSITQSVGVVVLFLTSLAISLIICLLISRIPKVGRRVLYMRN